MTDQNNLSEREIEILKLVATGLTNREIAQKLTISPNTVKVHIRNIFEKISVASRTEATIYGIEHGLVDVPGGIEAAAEPAPPTRLEALRKYAWIGVPMVLLVIGLLTALIVNSLRPQPPENQALAELAERWQQLEPMPAARAGMAAAAYDGQIYAIAGEGPDGVSGSVFRYAPETDTWTQLSDKPTPVADVHGVLIGEKIYVPGGRGADGAPTDILEIYDPRRDTWSAGAPLPQPVSAYALADFEGQMYLFGGSDGKRALDVVYIYDPVADAWREGTHMAIARQNHGAIALADKIVVLGGRNETGALNEAVGYFPSRDAAGEEPWEGFVDLPEARYGFGAAGLQETVYVMGGNPEFQHGYVFSEGSWDHLETEFTLSSQSPKLVPIGSLLYFIESADEEQESHIWKYTAFYFEIFLPFIQ